MGRLARVGRWQVEAEVARGGMGVVYRARSPEGRPAALKLLVAGKSSRIATELKSLLRVRHPNVVELLDAGEHDGVPYLVMEWIEGQTLARRLRAGPLAPDDAVELIRRLAGALEHCHAQGVIHRDLKPENVLIRARDGEPLLTDFGLARDAVAAESATRETAEGGYLGTPGWWPPEQARGDLAAIGPRSDVYGLGALLYGALTGVPPQRDTSMHELASGFARPPIAPGRRREGVPAWLDEVCLRALAIDPEERPADAAELRRALEARGADVPRASPGILLALAAAATLALAAAGIALVSAARRDRGPAVPASAAVAPAPSLSVPALAPVSTAQGAAEPPRPVDEARRARARTHHERGALLAGRGEHEDAIDCYDRAIELDPGFAAAWANRAKARATLGRTEGALQDLDRAIELDPDNPVALGNRGALRTRLGHHADAIADFDRALRLDPLHAQARANRGFANAALEQREAALADWQRALEQEPDAPWAALVRAQIERVRTELELPAELR